MIFPNRDPQRSDSTCPAESATARATPARPVQRLRLAASSASVVLADPLTACPVRSLERIDRSLSFPRKESGRETGRPTPGPPSCLRWRREIRDEPGQHVVLPSDANRSEAGRTAGNRSVLIVPSMSGNSRSARTRRREAGRHIKQAMLGPFPVCYAAAGAQKPESRINETASDSRVGETLAGVGFHKSCSPD